MSVSIDITNLSREERIKLANEFSEQYNRGIEFFMNTIENEEDRTAAKEIASKISSLYIEMCMASYEKREAIQRTLNSLKSSLSAISARNGVDIAEKVLEACKKSASSSAISSLDFVVL